MRRQRAEEVGTDSPGGAPAPKRRRLTGSSTVLRPAAELRESLELLYVRLQGEPVADDAPPSANPSFLQAEMVIVRALGASGEQSFRCLRSLLASASRPLAAMLYGSDGLRMRESDAGTIDLHSVEPSTFALLLHYMHGKALQLDVQSATSLYALADYYDISSLREACCDFLKAGVRPDCVCWWLSQAREIRCERLASRCLEVLQAELIAVDATDPDFRSIAEADLACALMSSSVVCTGERDVWDALQRWAHGRADQPAALERLARHIRWPLLEGAQLQALLSARSSRSLAFLRAHASAALEYQRASAEAREADPSFARMAELAMPRQYLLGELIVVSQPGGAPDEPRPIKPGDEFTVGRSRRSDLIFANPFVSSTHCRIFIDEVGEGAARELEVKLKDVSSNGAYVNSELVGRDNVVSLKHGDRISVVRPQGVYGEGAGGGNANVGYILFQQRRAPVRGLDANASKGEVSGRETEAQEAAPVLAEDAALTPDE